MKPCNQCGKCCLKYADGGLVATREEVERWEIERPDIFAYVRDGEIWRSPDTGAPLVRCPWLSEGGPPFVCLIYDQRPEDCQSYPTNLADMVRDECEMIELKDLRDADQARARLAVLTDR